MAVETTRQLFFCDDVAIFDGKLRLTKTKNDDFWLKLLKKIDSDSVIINCLIQKTHVLFKDRARRKNPRESFPDGKG